MQIFNLERKRSLEKEVSRERVRGILEQIVVCPGPLDAPRPLRKNKILVEIYPLEKIWRPTYMASQENVVIKAAVEVFLQATSH